MRNFAQSYGVVLGEVALVEVAGSPKSRRNFLGEVLKAGPNVAHRSRGLNRARRRLKTSLFELGCTDYEQQRKIGCSMFDFLPSACSTFACMGGWWSSWVSLHIVVSSQRSGSSARVSLIRTNPSGTVVRA